MGPHSSTLAWKIPWMEEPGGPQSMGSQRVGHDSTTSLSLFTFMHWRRKWQPTPVFLPGESWGRGSLVGCCLWGRTESDTTGDLAAAACFIDYAKAFDCVDHHKLWKILQEMGIPDHLTCLLRNLYARQKATVRTGHGPMDWVKIGKGVCQGCILSPCLFNIYRVHNVKCWTG